VATKLSVDVQIDKADLTEAAAAEIQSAVVRKVGLMVAGGETTDTVEVSGIKIHINHSRHRNGDSRHGQWGGGAGGPIIIK
jgi:hypothetical protein